ncbi:MAG: glycosyltransferase [Thermoguttaceae bacterium]
MNEPVSIRRRLRRLAGGALRRVGLHDVAVRALRMRRPSPGQMVEPCPAFEEDPPGSYDVICLPVISWASRFQRPQQLMRQWAARGHRVFYASLAFHGTADASLTPIDSAELGDLATVMELTLPGRPELSVYRHVPTAAEVACMADAMDRLRRQQRIGAAVVVVELPFWNTLAETLRQRFGWPIVYDCMDDHSGFSTNSASMLQAEDRTVAKADLVVVTSDLLEEKVGRKAKRTALIRNACDYRHFASVADMPTQNRTAPTIGFYGAIAEWFDADLVADLAQLRPNWNFDLIGGTHTGDVTRLETAPNVLLLGEKPYAELPKWLASWDCCMIPFKRLPLTEATNPVKAYEMLAAGKPIVAVDLPELRPLASQGLVTLADNAAGFSAAIERAMAKNSPAQQEDRRKFAEVNTWEQRYEALDKQVRELFPLVSIVVVTYNNLALNQACLESIYRKTDWPNFEVIVVDNASRDGTAEWLQAEQAIRPRLQVILNQDNRGFSGANNQGMRAAHGDYFCLLNNDTLVTRGWLSTLVGHLRTWPDLGLIGPVSNRVGNEAKVPVGYATPAEMPRWAAQYCWQHDGETFPIEMLGFFCVVFPRQVYRHVGELDERFGVGCFEDDDYCRRVRAEGYQIRCARDAFVHHWLEASFQLLKRQEYLDIFHENKRRYEAKWAAEEAVKTGR